MEGMPRQWRNFFRKKYFDAHSGLLNFFPSPLSVHQKMSYRPPLFSLPPLAITNDRSLKPVLSSILIWSLTPGGGAHLQYVLTCVSANSQKRVLFSGRGSALSGSEKRVPFSSDFGKKGTFLATHITGTVLVLS